MTRTDACWVCGSASTEPDSDGGVTAPLRSDDLKISDKRYGLTLPLQRCRACGFVFARAATVPQLTQLYAQLDDPEYGASAVGRSRQMVHLLRWATHDLPEPSTLLDVGAASGILLTEAEPLGLDGVGVEPSGPLVRHARDAGLTVHEGVLPHPDLEGSVFNIVTLVDVIEHVDDPVGLLEQCRRYLAPGGRLVVVTPDRASAAARLLRKRWWHRRLAHVGYFDKASLTRALTRSGFTATRWSRPRWYFPVGYLLVRIRQYLPGAARSGSEESSRDTKSSVGRVIPLNLRDSWAVIAHATP